MRRGPHPEWLVIDEKLVGLNLSADYTAEHEWGIGNLKRILGVDGWVPECSGEKPKYTKPHGIARRQITKSDVVRFYEEGDRVALIVDRLWWRENEKPTFKSSVGSELRLYEGSTLSAAWDGGSLGVHACGADADKVRELHAAFLANNIAIWVGGGMLFENGGLVLAIMDRIPADKLETLRENDLDVERLAAASDATGILKRLADAKKGYFACSPLWKGENGKHSVRPVIYWLNPMEQGLNNYGWFTVEELDLWIAGKGPIPKKREKACK